MVRVVFLLLSSFLAAAASAQGADSIVGSRQFRNNEMEIVAELSADGTFCQVNVSAKGRETYTGRYQLTGQLERDRSDYHYRWVNNQGDYLYTDENSFDPNKYEEYNTREWKRTPLKQR